MARGESDIAKAMKRSPRLLDYLRTRYELIAPHVGDGRHHDWSLLSSIVDERRLTDAYGRKPSKASIARTWAKVVEERHRADEWKSAVTVRHQPIMTRGPPARPSGVVARSDGKTSNNEAVDAIFDETEARRVQRRLDL